MLEYKFWIYFCGFMAIVIITLILNINIYYTNRNQMVVEMVKQGVSPAEALCGIDNIEGRNPTCVLYAVKQKDIAKRENID